MRRKLNYHSEPPRHSNRELNTRGRRCGRTNADARRPWSERDHRNQRKIATPRQLLNAHSIRAVFRAGDRNQGLAFSFVLRLRINRPFSRQNIEDTSSSIWCTSAVEQSVVNLTARCRNVSSVGFTAEVRLHFGSICPNRHLGSAVCVFSFDRAPVGFLNGAVLAERAFDLPRHQTRSR